jgi:hypothetical protein
MLWAGGRALSYQPVIEGLALLAVSREFPDERYLARILRLRIAPFSGGADGLAVHLPVDGLLNNVEVLLCQLDIGLEPKSQKLRLSLQPDDEGGATTITLSDDDIAVLYELLTEARAWRPKLQCRLDPSQQRIRQLPARRPAPEAGLRDGFRSPLSA